MVLTVYGRPFTCRSGPVKSDEESSWWLRIDSDSELFSAYLGRARAADWWAMDHRTDGAVVCQSRERTKKADI